MRITRNLLCSLGICICAVLFTAYSAMAQTDKATISGQIVDSSGAIVRGASVELHNMQQGTSLMATTNDAGIYIFPAVEPGQYSVTVRKQGFKQVDLVGVTANVQAHIEQNFKLQVGSVSESVTVTADGINIDKSGGTVSTVIDHTFIDEMPLNGNSLSTLFELTPGAVTNTGSSAQGGGLSVNGERATSNYLTVDGASENIYVPATTNTTNTNVTGQGIPVSASGGTNGLLPTDAVEEYRIQTSTYSAEYGRTPGGQIGIRTRGGTNDFHGSVFENFRNQVMDATDYFVKFLNEKQTPLRMNDFGGSVGGPILHDKLFFFAAHESLLMAQPQPGVSVDVPSACARTAAASQFQPFLAALPMGNAGPDSKTAICNASLQDPYISDILNASFSQAIADHSTSVRIDANLPWRSRAFFRFNAAPSHSLSANWYPVNNSINIWTATGGVTSTIAPGIVNEFTLNYSHDNSQAIYSVASYGGNNPSAFVSAVAGVANPANTEFLFASTVWSGQYPTIGPTQVNSISQWNAIDTLAWTLGGHSMKAGVDYLWRNPALKPYSLFLEPIVTSFANIQSGTVNTLSYNQYYSNPNIKLTNLSFFGNDTWRINKTLTLNYGLRWEINPSPSASGPGLFAIQGNVANPSSITEAPAGSPLFSTVYSNFAPRFGFASSLRDNPRFGTIVRGGAGIFFDTGTAATAAQAAGEGYPYKGNGSLSNIKYSSINFAGLVSSTPSLPQSNLYITDPNLKAPRTYQWSLTLEQQLGADTSLSTSYVASDSQNLINTVSQTDATFNSSVIYFQNPLLTAASGTFHLVTNGAELNYQSLQTQLRTRLDSRLEAIASWTWAHSINTGSSDFTGPYTIAQYSLRSDSASDIRHIFSAAVHYSPAGITSGRVLKAISQGWALDTIALLQTASPLSVAANLPSSISTVNQYNLLANVVPGVPVILTTSSAPGGKQLNPAAFAAVTCACNGNSKMNGYRLFGLTQWDLAAGRTWNLWERTSLNFRVDAFDILNIPNFANVNALYNPNNLRTFGQAQNTYAGNSPTGALNPVFQNGGARSIQLSAKIKF